jgi:predicted peroxiredoxin
MNKFFNAEVAVTSDRSDQSQVRSGQGVTMRVQAGATQPVRARLDVEPGIFEGEGVNTASSEGVSLSLESLRVSPDVPADGVARAPSLKDGDDWTLVQRRRRKRSLADVALDNKFMLWDVPQHADITRVRHLLKATKGLLLSWQGIGSSRHVAGEFTNSLHRIMHEGTFKTTCKELKIRLLPARSFSKRAEHRHLGTEQRQLRAKSPTKIKKRARLAQAYRIKKRGGRILLPNPKRQAPTGVKLSVRKLTKAGKFLKVGSFNVAKGFKSKGAELEAYFEREGYDVIALQEVTSACPQFEHYKVFYPKARDMLSGGVAIMVCNSLTVATSVELDETTDQLWIRIASSGHLPDLVVCSAYMPGERESALIRSAAFESLGEATVKFEDDDTCDYFLCGDLNSRLGPPTTPLEIELIGRYGETVKRTPNGGLLVSKVLTASSAVNIGAQTPPHRTRFRCGGRFGSPGRTVARRRVPSTT